VKVTGFTCISLSTISEIADRQSLLPETQPSPRKALIPALSRAGG